MPVKTRRSGNVTTIDIDGPMRMGDTEQSFRDTVQGLIDSGAKQFAINLTGVPEMDSSGIGALVRVYSTVKHSGGRCIFFGPTKRVTMLLKMVRLDTILELFEDEPTALARF